MTEEWNLDFLSLFCIYLVAMYVKSITYKQCITAACKMGDNKKFFHHYVRSQFYVVPTIRCVVYFI